MSQANMVDRNPVNWRHIRKREQVKTILPERRCRPYGVGKSGPEPGELLFDILER
jgi:hypothetical protein